MYLLGLITGSKNTLLGLITTLKKAIVGISSVGISSPAGGMDRGLWAYHLLKVIKKAATHLLLRGDFLTCTPVVSSLFHIQEHNARPMRLHRHSCTYVSIVSNKCGLGELKQSVKECNSESHCFALRF